MWKIIGVIVASIMAATVFLSASATPLSALKQTHPVRARPGEELLHTTPGANKPGAPAELPGGQRIEVVIRVVDADTGKLAAARLNVIGTGGNYYFPDGDRHDLAEYSLHRAGNRYCSFFHRPKPAHCLKAVGCVAEVARRAT